MKNKNITKALMSWYDDNHRKLPWRETSDPYSIWISETMLQQTRVETVISYYVRFLKELPTIADLADADEEKVLKLWEGLGYYSRARNLQAAAKQIVENFNGQMPSNPEDLKTLKGVGPYTVGAVGSIAFGIAIPAVDGNVMRVISRIDARYDDIAKAKTRGLIETRVKELIDYDRPGIFNQALMELGATICIPKNPRCEQCPVQKDCVAFDKELTSELPIKTKAKKQRVEKRIVFYIENADGEILIRKRSDKGLLANMWELPHEIIESETVIWQVEELQKGMQVADVSGKPKELQWSAPLNIVIEEYMTFMTHIFSHIIWELYVVRGTLVEGTELPEGYFWSTPEMRKELAFPTPFVKILTEYI